MNLHYKGCLIVFDNNINQWLVFSPVIYNMLPDWARECMPYAGDTLKEVTAFIDRWS